LDRSIWSWDPALYGLGAVDLWYRLVRDWPHWLNAMLSVYVGKAPALAWLGQFFVPLGQWYGSVEVGLLCSILLLQAASLVLVFDVGRVIAPNSQFVATIGMLVLGAAPLFIRMSHHYMSEPSQLFSVVYVYWIAARSPSLRGPRLVGHLILAISIGFLTKINTVAYFVMPLGLALYSLWKPPTRRAWFPTAAKDLALCLVAVMVAVLTIAWYSRNGRQTYQFALSAASGDLSIYYGHEGALTSKLKYWLNVFLESFVSVPDGLWLLLLGVSAGILLALTIGSSRRRFTSNSEASTTLVWAAVSQAALLLVLFALATNEEARVALAVGPSLVIPLMALISRWRCMPVYVGLVAALFGQWSVVQARNLGIARQRDTSYLGNPPRGTDSRAADIERTVSLTCTAETTNRWIITGSNLDWFNFYSLQFYSAKSQFRTSHRCFYWYWGIAEHDPDGAWQLMTALNTPYFISVEPSAVPTDLLNPVSVAVLRKVMADRSFVREPLETDTHVMVFKRLQKPSGHP